jgi:hypothetical protein
VYYFFNGRWRKEDFRDSALENLRQLYQQYNKRLQLELSKRGCTQLPQWLDI